METKFLLSSHFVRIGISHPFDEWPVFYYKRTIAATHSFKFTVFSQHLLLPPSILLQAVCGWFEKNWMICLFEKNHYSPALLKVSIYSTELLAVIFVWKVLCQMHESTCSHPIVSLVNVLICNFTTVITVIH